MWATNTDDAVYRRTWTDLRFELHLDLEFVNWVFQKGFCKLALSGVGKELEKGWGGVGKGWGGVWEGLGTGWGRVRLSILPKPRLKNPSI